MNRNKGIWITIISILVIGISVSFATRQYIRKEEEQAGVSAASSFYDGEVSPVVMDSSADAETKAETSGDEGAVPAPVSADVGENIPSDSMENRAEAWKYRLKAEFPRERVSRSSFLLLPAVIPGRLQRQKRVWEMAPRLLWTLSRAERKAT